MLIKCGTIHDFLANLENKVVFASTVYVDTIKNDANSDGSVKNLVIHATAVVELTAEGGQALVIAGEDCGMDYEPEIFEERQTQIQEYCSAHSLIVKPGILDM